MAGDYIGKHSGYTFEAVCQSVEFWARATNAPSLYDAAALLREQAAEIERLRGKEQAREPHDECPLWPREDGR